jgi:periplasmic divalent cation tolerance protein
MIFILVTCADAAQAEAIAGRVVEERLAACVHVMPPHRSVYRWQGKVERAEEINILIKTRAERFEDVRRAVLAMHSYEVPCIVSWAVTQGHGPFMDWVAEQTAV